VWQTAGLVEEIPEARNFITYEIGDDSILIVRVASEKLKAFHNVCPHRGRRLIDMPNGANRACGKRQRFVCGFHGWTYNLEGKNTFVLDPGG
jgi:phenylpropionate dioxygenase-like ring-hydroxylating dioxygenase large terminal subunit